MKLSIKDFVSKHNQVRQKNVTKKKKKFCAEFFDPFFFIKIFLTFFAKKCSLIKITGELQIDSQ